MENNIYSKYSHQEIIHSKYCYEDCDVLRNKLNIKDELRLKLLEEDLTNHRIAELIDNPLNGRFGLTHLKRIHKYIFQDIYPFAGKFREEDIWKGSTFFSKYQFISIGLTDFLTNLKLENYLINLNSRKFSERAAYYMAELNMIHPFREGNGRTIREFIRCLALKCGFVINWSLIDSQKLLAASILSVDKKYAPLAECIYTAIENN